MPNPRNQPQEIPANYSFWLKCLIGLTTAALTVAAFLFASKVIALAIGVLGGIFFFSSFFGNNGPRVPVVAGRARAYENGPPVINPQYGPGYDPNRGPFFPRHHQHGTNGRRPTHHAHRNAPQASVRAYQHGHWQDNNPPDPRLFNNSRRPSTARVQAPAMDFNHPQYPPPPP